MTGWLHWFSAKHDAKKHQPRSRKKRLRFERLEQRRLLAADLGAISGSVFTDLDNDGLFEPAAGETGIAGAQISLSGTDDQGLVTRAPQLTGADGSYRFDNLRAGTYTLTQLPPPPVGVLPSSSGQSIDVTISAAQAAGTMGVVVDSFSGTQQVLTATAPSGLNPVSESVADNSVLGGTRDIFVDVTSNTGIATVTSNAPFLPGVLDINPGSSTSGRYVISWDGDSDPVSLSPAGLAGSGLDLTNGGTMDGLLIRMGVDKPNEFLTLRVYSDVNNWSEATVGLPNTGGLATGEVFIPWSGFSVGAGTGGDVTQVGAVQLEIDAQINAMDGQIDVIGSLGPTVLTTNFANTPALPGIDIEKSTNGFDADSGDGPFVPSGGAVLFEYIVRNTGNTALANVIVDDDNGSSGNSSDDFNPIFMGGDADNDGLLDINETWLYQATGAAALGAYVNFGQVTGNPVSQSGVDIAGVADVSDVDPSRHFAVSPGIGIEKSTNGFDADSGDGPLIASGANVLFEYVVRNTGNTALGNVVVQDDNGTSGDSLDDFNPTFVGGDIDNDGLLDTSEVWTYQASRLAAPGAYVNLGQVSGNPVSSAGADIAALPDVNDVDPSRHFGVTAAIDIEKSTNGRDADTGNGPLVASGETVVFDYVVTNSGNTELAGVVVTDDNGTPGDLSDDFAPSFQSGDTDNDGLLDTNEVWLYRGTTVAAVGSYVNLGDVSANPVSSTGADIPGLQDVTDQDPSRHFAAFASIDIEKATNGFDADTGTGPFAAVGSTVEFTFVVTNTGNVALADVQVEDADLAFVAFVGGDTDGDGLLDVQETWTYTGTTTAEAGQYACEGVVRANPVSGDGSDIATLADVSDVDPSHHFGVVSMIHLEKSTNGEDADVGPGVSVPAGAPITFQFVITNPGNQPLRNVTLIDDAGTPSNSADDVIPTFIGGDDNNDGLLDPNEAWLYEWLSTAVVGPYENRAVAVADDLFAQSVTDDDLSHHLGLEPINPNAIPPNVPNKRRFLSSRW